MECNSIPEHCRAFTLPTAHRHGDRTHCHAPKIERCISVSRVACDVLWRAPVEPPTGTVSIAVAGMVGILPCNCTNSSAFLHTVRHAFARSAYPHRYPTATHTRDSVTFLFLHCGLQPRRFQPVWTAFTDYARTLHCLLLPTLPGTHGGTARCRVRDAAVA